MIKTFRRAFFVIAGVLCLFIVSVAFAEHPEISRIKVDELKKIIPSAKLMIYFPVFVLQIFMVAFLLFSENIFYPLLLMIVAAVLMGGMKNSKLENKFKQIIESN